MFFDEVQDFIAFIIVQFSVRFRVILKCTTNCNEGMRFRAPGLLPV